MERKELWGRKLLLSMGVAGMSVVAAAQPEPPPQTTAVSPPLSRSLGLFAYPQEGQPGAQQAWDESECFTWARTQTGIDPLAPSGEVPVQKAADGEQAEKEGASPRAALGSAAGGAAAGTAIGAIAGETGKGAAIGATAGVLRGARQARRDAKEAEMKAARARTEAKEKAAAQATTATQLQLETFNRAFGACLEARHYTVK
jgi:hypothetical protein